MENTIENKAKFFAQYLGQKVLLDNTENGLHPMKIVGFMDEKNVQVEYHAGLTAYYKTNETVCLLLKSLKDISNEEAVEISKIEYSWNEVALDPEDVIEWLEEILYNNSCTIADYVSGQEILEVTDYLKSKGYALPWMGLSVEKQIEYGWVSIV